MQNHHLKIDGTLTGMGTKVYLDDMELHGVRSIKYEVGLDRITTAKIELDVMVAGEIESDAAVSFCSTSETIDNLVLNRDEKELLLFGNKILNELDRRNGRAGVFRHGKYENENKTDKDKE